MNIRFLASFGSGVLVTVACHDSPPPAQPASGGEQETEVNRVHREVKENLGEAASKAKNAVDSVQRKVQEGAGKAGAELGVRPAVVGKPPPGDAGAR